MANKFTDIWSWTKTAFFSFFSLISMLLSTLYKNKIVLFRLLNMRFSAMFFLPFTRGQRRQCASPHPKEMKSGFLVLLLHEPLAGSDVQFELVHEPRVLFSSFDEFLQGNLTWAWVPGTVSYTQTQLSIVVITTVTLRLSPTYCLCSCPPAQIFCHKCLQSPLWCSRQCVSWFCG